MLFLSQSGIELKQNCEKDLCAQYSLILAIISNIFIFPALFLYILADKRIIITAYTRVLSLETSKKTDSITKNELISVESDQFSLSTSRKNHDEIIAGTNTKRGSLYPPEKEPTDNFEISKNDFLVMQNLKENNN